ncbi:hypothetical protein MKX01_029098 [Papaver californicum]|nr:hypothetical protein MKX01_007331 [Papaver californicum]KAI3975806.1 hypothetical protein MKX01_029098 [Papaver californicum]
MPYSPKREKSKTSKKTMRIAPKSDDKIAMLVGSKASGECSPFDRLALKAPFGQNMAVKHFSGAPGVPHGHSKPYVRSKGQKFEKARGKRNNHGFRI